MTILYSSLAIAQVDRLVLFESFSGENCGPCAAINPQVSALYEANKDRVLMLKYQLPIPSAGPIYNEAKAGGFDASTRGSFYAVNSAPWGQQDGLKLRSNSNHPAYWTDSLITARAAVKSPISINVSHTYSQDDKKITIEYEIKNETSAAISGTNRIYIALFEELMTYLTAPGTNGETEFHNIVRNMYGTDGKTSITGSSITLPAAGQSINGTVTIDIPTYIRNRESLRVAVFVQNSTTKEVLQSGSSNLTPLNNPVNASLNVRIPSASNLCTQMVIPSVVFKNVGNVEIKTAKISYGLTSSTSPQVYRFNGSLKKGDSISVTLNPVTPNYNAFSVIYAKIDSVNNAMDVNASDNEGRTVIFATNPIPKDLEVKEDFEDFELGSTVFNNGGLFDPVGAGFVVDKTIGGTSVTQELGGFATSTKSLRFRPSNSAFGYSFSYIFDKINLYGVTSAANSKFYFSFAHARSTSSSADSLYLEVSEDCGVTWKSIGSRSSTQLSTVSSFIDWNGTSGRVFYPAANQWKKDSFDLKAYNGKSNLMLRLRVKVPTGSTQADVAKVGNAIYFDDISIKTTETAKQAPFIVVPDSLYISKLITSDPKDTMVEFNHDFINVKSGDQVTWKLTKLNLISGWNLISICDNIYCKNDPPLNFEQKFDAKDNRADNFLKIELSHNKKPGYGSFNIQVHRNSGQDATLSTKTVKYVLFVSKSTASLQTINENDQIFYYFDKFLYFDSEFTKKNLVIYDMSGREVVKKLITQQAFSIEDYHLKGSYIATIQDEGMIYKSMKFIAE